MLGANSLWRDLHYEKTSSSAIFTVGGSFPRFVRKRTGRDLNDNHNPADNGHATDGGAVDDDYALLIPLQRGKRAREQRALLRFLRFLVFSLGGLGFFFSLTDHRGDGLKLFATAQIH